MYRFLLFFCTAIALLYLTSCREITIRGTGATKAEHRKVAAFDHISFSFPVDAEVRVVPGSVPDVELDGYSNILDHITVKVVNGKLMVYGKKDVQLVSDKRVKATIILPSLTGLESSGSSQVTVKGTVAGKELGVDLSGSGEINIDAVQLETLTVDVNGSGKVAINSGSARQGGYEINGSGKIYALELVHTEAAVEINGSGYVEVNATQALSVDVSGSGIVGYRGSPSVESDINGSGSVKDLN